MKIQLRMKNEDGQKGKVLMKNIFRYRDFASSFEFTDRHDDKPVKPQIFFTITSNNHSQMEKQV